MMADKKKKTDEPTVSEVEKLRAECISDLNKQLEMYDTMDGLPIGTYVNIPREFEGWHICRYSLAVPHQREIAYMLLRTGYKLAKGKFDGQKEYIPSLRCIGFERGADVSLYLMCPPEIKIQQERRKADKKRQKERLTRNDGFGGHLGGIQGEVSIERKNLN